MRHELSRRIGRVLVASLHQAIADVLPNRLEFYENWLNASGLREGTIGLAPLSAVLSFLRTEGEAYSSITGARRRVRGGLDGQQPVGVRAPGDPRAAGRRCARARALRTARALVRVTYPGSRAIVRVKRGIGVDRPARIALLRGARGVGAAAVRVLRRGDRARPAAVRAQADAHVNECRAAGSRARAAC